MALGDTEGDTAISQLGWGTPGPLPVPAATHFSKPKSGKRMLFLMKRVKFSASSMMGLGEGEEGGVPGDHGTGGTEPCPSCVPPGHTHTSTVSTSGGHQPRISQVRRVPL